jgi:hypothetical protein
MHQPLFEKNLTSDGVGVDLFRGESDQPELLGMIA